MKAIDTPGLRKSYVENGGVHFAFAKGRLLSYAWTGVHMVLGMEGKDSRISWSSSFWGLSYARCGFAVEANERRFLESPGLNACTVIPPTTLLVCHICGIQPDL